MDGIVVFINCAIEFLLFFSCLNERPFVNARMDVDSVVVLNSSQIVCAFDIMYNKVKSIV